jgi:hypothetical protein
MRKEKYEGEIKRRREVKEEEEKGGRGKGRGGKVGEGRRE